jgi:hypothetical protein
MARSLLMLCLFVLAACGRDPTLEERSEFEPYLERFQAYSAQYGRDASNDGRVRILFGILKANEIGVCEQSPFQPPRVLVSRSAWAIRSDVGREALIFHELGHCLLDRDHRDDVVRLTGGRGGRTVVAPASLMHTRGVRPQLYAESKDYYLRELFTSR